MFLGFGQFPLFGSAAAENAVIHSAICGAGSKAPEPAGPKSAKESHRWSAIPNQRWTSVGAEWARTAAALEGVAGPSTTRYDD